MTGSINLSPGSFFQLSLNSFYLPPGTYLTAAHRLPSPMIDEEQATVAMGWNEQALVFNFSINGLFERSCFPHFENGDAIFLCIDTRDLKKTRSVHRFCHHFFFLPASVGDVQAGECTRLRADESRPLCSAHLLSTVICRHEKFVEMTLTIPATCLHGYSPQDHPRIGFSYVIYRGFRSPQSLNCCTREVSIAQHPELWASMTLRNA